MIAWLKSDYAKTMGLSIVFGMLFWVIDGYFEYTFFHKNLKFMLLEGPETLTESLFTKVPMHSLFVRISFIFAVFIGGILLALFLYRKNMIQKDLRQSEETFSGFFSQGNIGMAITSLEKGWLNANKKLCKMLGYSKQELLQKTWTEMTYPDDLEPALVLFKKMVSGEIDDYEMEKRFIRKDKNIIYTYLTVSCIRYADESVDKVLATLQDITNRKQMQDEIEHYHEHLEEMVKQRTNELTIANQQLNHEIEERKMAGDALKKRTDELNTMVNAMAGREVRMAELKKVIERLHTQIESEGLTPVAADPLKEVGSDYT